VSDRDDIYAVIKGTTINNDGAAKVGYTAPSVEQYAALVREAQIVAGVTYNPATGDLYWTEKGKGAFWNDRRIRVAARSRLEDCVIATGIPYAGHGQHARFLKELHQISARVAGVRRFGSASLDLAGVAAGRFDAYWERDLGAWHIAAGVLMVAEAGGKVSDLDGGDVRLEEGSICVANQDLHKQVLARLQAAA
jgi:myo-inositol-1(or 4)-monophosphatase